MVKHPHPRLALDVLAPTGSMAHETDQTNHWSDRSRSRRTGRAFTTGPSRRQDRSGKTLVLPADPAPRSSCRLEPEPVAQPHRPLRLRQVGRRRHQTRAARRSQNAHPPPLLRPHRPAARPSGSQRIPGRHVARRHRQIGRSTPWPAPTLASAPGGTGSTSSASPRPMATSAMAPNRAPGATATIVSTPSIMINRIAGS